MKLINRHNILIEEFDPLNSLSIGNENFAFTTDITGLQTFYKEYESGVSLGTMTNWGWHTVPNTEHFNISETYSYHNINGRQVPYEDQIRTSDRSIRAANYFRENPHRLHLGLIRLIIKKKNGEEISISDIQKPKHQLNLWCGEISSNFKIEDIPVEVNVFVHPELDLVSAKIKSPLIELGRLSVEWLFPYGNSTHTHAGYNFNSPEKHTSIYKKINEFSVSIERKLVLS